MEKRVASSVFLLVLSVAVAGLSAAASSGDTDIIRLPSDAGNNANDDDDRPWKCCNLPRCTRSQPPTCQCFDRVKRCSDTCRECVSVEPSREVCVDRYRGDLPPRCDDGEVVVHYGVVTTGAMKKKDDDDEDKRPPWKCCNRAVIGPSTTWPPVWYCMDKLERCDCQQCMKVEEEADGHSDSYYFCLDGYKGNNPGPSCAHHGARRP